MATKQFTLAFVILFSMALWGQGVDTTPSASKGDGNQSGPTFTVTDCTSDGEICSGIIKRVAPLNIPGVPVGATVAVGGGPNLSGNIDSTQGGGSASGFWSAVTSVPNLLMAEPLPNGHVSVPSMRSTLIGTGTSVAIAGGAELGSATGVFTALNSFWLTRGAYLVAMFGCAELCGDYGFPEFPATTEQSVAKKVLTYLLDPNHPKGAIKAAFFKQALGFTLKNASELGRQLVFNEEQAVPTVLTRNGQKFSQIINVVGANGRIIPVQTIWIRNSWDNVVRLVTAVPGD
jgi:hypothetical protein